MAKVVVTAYRISKSSFTLTVYGESLGVAQTIEAHLAFSVFPSASSGEILENRDRT